jgi:hypothetical protein
MMLGHTPVLDEVIDVAPVPGWTATRCRLRVFRGAAGAPVAVVTELRENPGPSVTNAAEHIWRELSRRLETTRFVMVEHYGPESYPVADEDVMGFDVVTLTNSRPEWRPLSAHDLRGLMEDN